MIAVTEVRARVILQEKGKYRISFDGNEKWAEVSGKYRYETTSVSDYPAVGDYVIAAWPADGSNATITGLFPRKSVFIRKAAGTNQEQVVAANIDTLFLCMSLNQDFNLRRMERYLAIAWDSGAVPVVVLTKTDLCDNVAARVLEVEGIAAGVDIITVSSQSDDIAAVGKYLLPGITVAFLGSSGVGKSTLINKILGENTLETAEIRNDDKGRHTTTHRELITLKNQAFVMDTPGMRELGMWNNAHGIDEVFSDIERITSRCRFSDCTHVSEPGCAILAALQSGELTPDRWDSYQKLKAENAYVANESAYLQAKKAKFKEIAKINKKMKQKR